MPYAKSSPGFPPPRLPRVAWYLLVANLAVSLASLARGMM